MHFFYNTDIFHQCFYRSYIHYHSWSLERDIIYSYTLAIAIKYISVCISLRDYGILWVFSYVCLLRSSWSCLFFCRFLFGTLFCVSVFNIYCFESPATNSVCHNHSLFCIVYVFDLLNQQKPINHMSLLFFASRRCIALYMVVNFLVF